MSDNFPPPPPPESGEEQYRQWVEQMRDGMRSGRLQPAQPVTSAAGTGETGDSSASAGTEVMERSVLPRPVVTLGQDHVQADPGQPVRVKVTVRNVGPVVETYALSVVGEDSSWLTLVPNEVSLFPGDEGTSSVVIKPTRSSRLPSQDYTFGVMARSEVDPNESSVAQLTVSLGPFYDSTLSVSRTTVEIRRRATTYAQVTNNGNTRVLFHLDVSDPDGYLRFKVEDPEFELAPGETAWKKVLIKGPLHLIGRQRTLSMLSELHSERDVSRDTALQDVRSGVQRVTIIQRPLLRLRLGIFGRLIILLALVGIVAAFIISRMNLTGNTDVVSGPPPTPPGFTAEAFDTSKVLLRWGPVAGASGYSIYAVGDTGNALSTDESATTTDATTGVPASLGFGALRIVPASVRQGGGSPSPGTGGSAPTPAGSSSDPASDTSGSGSPSPSPGSTTGVDSTQLEIESPSCGDCTHVADVPSGSARYVVTKTNPGENNCYRLIATDGERQSLYTPMVCAYVPSAAEVAAEQAPGGTPSETPDPPPCPPYLPKAEKLSPTALGLTWLPPNENKPAKKATGCSRKATVSGYEVQRQLLSGWTTVSPAPDASDTAIEVSDLEPATKYCFRMLTKGDSADSAYTETFCGKTKKLPPEPTPDATVDPTDPADPATAQQEGFVFEPEVLVEVP